MRKLVTIATENARLPSTPPGDEVHVSPQRPGGETTLRATAPSIAPTHAFFPSGSAADMFGPRRESAMPRTMPVPERSRRPWEFRPLVESIRPAPKRPPSPRQAKPKPGPTPTRKRARRGLCAAGKPVALSEGLLELRYQTRPELRLALEGVIEQRWAELAILERALDAVGSDVLDVACGHASQHGSGAACVCLGFRFARVCADCGVTFERCEVHGGIRGATFDLNAHRAEAHA